MAVGVILRSFGLAVSQLSDRRFRRVFFIGVALAFVLLVGSIFLMVPVASAITSMFLDDVADAVEAVHYPNLPPTTKVPFSDALRDTVNFLGVLIGANLLAVRSGWRAS